MSANPGNTIQDRPRHGRPAWTAMLSCPPAERANCRIHLVGIGGTGLSAIGSLLLSRGYVISGSDLAPNEATAELAARGAHIFHGHHAANVKGADLILISSAVPESNPEVAAARAAGIPVVKRAELLGELTAGQHGIGVAGSHGKTTTASMIAVILLRAGMDPSFIIGGRLAVGPAEGLETSSIAAHAGQGPFVVEADEYDGMFLGLHLEVGVVTNVDWDHVDCYPTPASFSDAFRKFVGQLPPGGLLVLCADDPGALSLADAARPRVEVATYGLTASADWQARDLLPNNYGGFDAQIWHAGELVTYLSLAVPGPHNVRNALAALAVAHWHGIRPGWAVAMLRDFQGAGRRFEFVGEAGGVTVIDDYAHHPTEVAATLTAARLRYATRRVWAVFQPHTYSRTKALMGDFAHSFDDADELVLLDIYPSREKIDLGMHSERLLAAIRHPSARYIGGIEAAAEYLLERVAPEDIVIMMSAGDGNRVGRLLLDGLRARGR